MNNSNNYTVDVNDPTEDPFVYYSDEHGRKLKGRIELVKPGLWGKKGKVILFLDSLKTWENTDEELSATDYVTALKRIIQDLATHDFIVELK
jgi:hypothetical protein